MKKLLNLLLFGYPEKDRLMIQKVLSDNHLHSDIYYASHIQEFVDLVTQVKFSVIISDLPDEQGDSIKAINYLRQKNLDIPFIYTSPDISEAKQLEYLNLGAIDLVLNSHLNRLPLAINRAIIEMQERKDLKEARQALTDSENSYRSLLQAIPDIVYKIDANGHFVFINNSVTKLGYQPEELIGQHFSVIISAEDVDRVSREKVLPDFYGKVTGKSNAPLLFDERRSGDRVTRDLKLRLNIKKKESGETDNIIYSEVYSTGSYQTMDLNYYTWAEVNAGGQYDESVYRGDRNFIGTVGIIHDISDRIRTENEIRKFSQAIVQSPVSVVITDTKGDITYVNEKLLSVTGYSRDELLGRNPRILKSGEMSLENYQKMWEIISHGGEWAGEFHNKKKNGELFWEYALISAVKNQNDEIYAYIGIKEDITERKKADTELKLALQQLEVFNRQLKDMVDDEVRKNREKDMVLIKQGRQAAMGEMIGNIAHQWRQPLNNLALLVQNIETAWEFKQLTEEKIQKTVSKSMQIIQFMSQTIDDFRNFFKPNKDKVYFSAEEMLFKAISFIEASFQNNNIQLTVSMDDDRFLYGYSSEFSQVILNILVNSKDVFLERKTEKPQVIIAMSVRKNHLTLKISDNAGGINQPVLDRIFEPYFTTKEHGTGIGLYMSQMIIEKNMNGTMTAENIDLENGDKGACFIIRLPCYQDKK